MRWSFIICLLLVSAVLTKPRPKRSLGYITSLFTNKLFGSHKVIIAQPILPKNENYQLFKIPGYNDIVIKVTRKDNKDPLLENDEHKPSKPIEVIVEPEVAIVGSYLGTTTQQETLLAIEMVKNMINSGILSGIRANSIKELVIPVIPEPPRIDHFDDRKVPIQLPILSPEQGHVFVPVGKMQVDNRNAFSIYPAEYPTEVKFTPAQSMYSYQQKGPNADMTYESYNNKDVIVTRTEKEPVLPKFIKIRIAEVATIGANPYTVRQPVRMNNGPVSVPYYINQGMMPENMHGVQSVLGYDSPIMVDRNPIVQPEPTRIGITNPYYFENNAQQIIRCKEKSVKLCPHDNVKVKINNGQYTTLKVNNQNMASKTPGEQNDVNNANSNINAHRIAVNEFLKNNSVNGQLVSQYLYRQINHHSNDNYTEVRVGEIPQLTKDATLNNTNLNRDYVFIPPKNADSPLVSVLSLNNGANIGNIDNQHNEKNAFISKIKPNDVPPQKSNEDYIKDSDFKHHPIVVSEQLHNDNGEEKSTPDIQTNKDNNEFNEYHRRGDIPGAAY